jgi:acylphosphatase
MNKRIVLKIFGLVQGVFFRQSAEKKALMFGLSGFVQNEKDGAVKVIAEGNEKNLKKFIDWCKKGPFFARVENVKVNWEKFRNEFNKFQIKY